MTNQELAGQLSEATNKLAELLDAVFEQEAEGELSPKACERIRDAVPSEWWALLPESVVHA